MCRVCLADDMRKERCRVAACTRKAPGRGSEPDGQAGRGTGLQGVGMMRRRKERGTSGGKPAVQAMRWGEGAGAGAAGGLCGRGWAVICTADSAIMQPLPAVDS